MNLDNEKKTPSQEFIQNIVSLVVKELKKDDELKKGNKPRLLVDEPIDEVIEALYQNGVEHYLTDGTAEQKEVLSRAITQIMADDTDLLLQLFMEITEASKLVYASDCRFSEPQPQKMQKLKEKMIGLFDVIETFKGDE